MTTTCEHRAGEQTVGHYGQRRQRRQRRLLHQSLQATMEKAKDKVCFWLLVFNEDFKDPILCKIDFTVVSL